MIFYTSDLHLGHTNIIKHSNRPFNTIEEMDEYLINMWNNVVQNTDTVYIIGDLIFRAQTDHIEEYLNKLKGHKHLIVGNHDRPWLNKPNKNYHRFFESVSPLLYAPNKSYSTVMCHYPMMTWPKENRGAYMVYGHIHNNIHDWFWPIIAQKDNMLNAGTDVNNYMPVTLDQMIQNNQKFKENWIQNGGQPYGK